LPKIAASKKKFLLKEIKLGSREVNFTMKRKPSASSLKRESQFVTTAQEIGATKTKHKMLVQKRISSR